MLRVDPMQLKLSTYMRSVLSDVQAAYAQSAKKRGQAAQKVKDKAEAACEAEAGVFADWGEEMSRTEPDVFVASSDASGALSTPLPASSVASTPVPVRGVVLKPMAVLPPSIKRTLESDWSACLPDCTVDKTTTNATTTMQESSAIVNKPPIICQPHRCENMQRPLQDTAPTTDKEQSTCMSNTRQITQTRSEMIRKPPTKIWIVETSKKIKQGCPPTNKPVIRKQHKPSSKYMIGNNANRVFRNTRKEPTLVNRGIRNC